MPHPQLIDLPRIADLRGDLSFIENSAQIPFEIRRVYWLTGVASGDWRYGHAFRSQSELIVALSGSFTVVTDCDQGPSTRRLENPSVGLFLPPLTWRELHGFSANAVALVLSSGSFDERDYIRSHDDFFQIIGRKP